MEPRSCSGVCSCGTRKALVCHPLLGTFCDRLSPPDMDSRKRSKGRNGISCKACQKAKRKCDGKVRGTSAFPVLRRHQHRDAMKRQFASWLAQHARIAVAVPCSASVLKVCPLGH